MLNRKFLQLYFLVSLLLPLSAIADGQFYFVATMATEGATSSSGQGAKVVYLRWDVLEGDLPARETAPSPVVQSRVSYPPRRCLSEAEDRSHSP